MPPPIGDVDPQTAWHALTSGEKCILVDVRTRAEWRSVGVPDLPSDCPELVLIEWQTYPAMKINPDFVDAALAAVKEEDAKTAFFICRSGVRSLHAAMMVGAAAAETGVELSCVNVAGGFEGDPRLQGSGGDGNGWKDQGLPWRQS